MISNIKSIIYIFLHKFFKLIGFCFYFNNGYGIKCFNKKNINTTQLKGKIKIIDYKYLYLGFDALDDRYTLIDVNIAMSPHFKLMKDIKFNNDINKSEYIYREKKGYLDGRFERIITRKDIAQHINIFEKNLNFIVQEKYTPVVVYELNKKYYILDGKHRASMCSLVGKKVICKVINKDTLKRDKYIQGIYKMMTKNDKKYTKNLQHIFEILYEENDKSEKN